MRSTAPTIEAARVPPGRVARPAELERTAPARARLGTPRPAAPEPEPSLGEALAEVAAAGQDLATDRFELLKLELLDGLKTQVIRVALFAAAGLLLGLGWLFLMASAVSGLSELIGVPLALLAVGAPHVLIGIGLAVSAAKRGSE